jgi:hypothetical protein
VVVSREQYDVFERMHYVCFHMEFEHDPHDPDEDCGVPGCPVTQAPLNYLQDVGSQLRTQAEEATAHARHNRDDAFAQGVAHGYYVALSLLLDQARAFRIPPEMLGLSELKPERDLL